jgi:hypothetical protein
MSSLEVYDLLRVKAMIIKRRTIPKTFSEGFCYKSGHLIPSRCFQKQTLAAKTEWF